MTRKAPVRTEPHPTFPLPVYDDVTPIKSVDQSTRIHEVRITWQARAKSLTVLSQESLRLPVSALPVYDDVTFYEISRSMDPDSRAFASHGIITPKAPIRTAPHPTFPRPCPTAYRLGRLAKGVQDCLTCVPALSFQNAWVLLGECSVKDSSVC